MACYHPIKGWKSKSVSSTGRRQIVFNPSLAYKDMPATIACGQCIGCRLERSRQWAMRCVHEAQLHDRNVFITLTYNDLHLPRDNSLNLDHFQRFMKRLRFHFSGRIIRFFHCGEYGEKYGRPHYHAIIFNLDFEDKKLWSISNGQKLYTSPTLDKLWSDPDSGQPLGFATIGEVTFESAAYVARYVMKKVTGPMAENHYSRLDENTGECYQIKPEYTTMSRRPGIGKGWYDKYKTDVYPSDFVVMRGDKKFKPPRFYDGLYEREYPSDMDKLKAKRARNAHSRLDDNTPERLNVRERVKLAQISKLKRTIDEEN